MLRQRRGKGLRRRPAGEHHRHGCLINITLAVAELLGAVATLLVALRAWLG